MHESRFPDARRVKAEIAHARQDSAGGYLGILGEMMRAFACLSDPVLRASVSPPFTASLGDLCRDAPACQLYLMPPAELIATWAPVLKALITAGLVHKSRAPAAPRQTWILDECAQLGVFPLIIKLFTYGAGIGIRPWAVFQSVQQMRALGPNADSIIASSAACKAFFGVRDLDSATMLSRTLGQETLAFHDPRQRAQAVRTRDRAARALLSGGDMLHIADELAFLSLYADTPQLKPRPLMGPDEVLNLGPTKQLLMVDGLPAPLLAGRAPYFEQRFMAGRFHPSPYHPPASKVRVKTRLGHAWRRVVTAPVPPAFQAYPQYAGGVLSHIEA